MQYSLVDLTRDFSPVGSAVLENCIEVPTNLLIFKTKQCLAVAQRTISIFINFSLALNGQQTSIPLHMTSGEGQ